jgi:hypothetical protein
MKDNFTYIAVVLDRSGSMQRVKHATISGFNEFLQKQKAIDGECQLRLAQFDDDYEVLYDKPVQHAEELSDHTYQPRNMTALLDAMGKTITELGNKLKALPESERPAKVLVATITDGLENASREYTRDKVFDMVKKQKEQFSWDFIFIGANQDAIATAATLNIDQGKALTYNASNFRSVLANSVVGYANSLRSSGVTGQSVNTVAFTDEDREAAVSA